MKNKKNRPLVSGKQIFAGFLLLVCIAMLISSVIFYF